MVVGTNGTPLTDARVAMLKEAGVSGVAVSVDSLDEERTTTSAAAPTRSSAPWTRSSGCARTGSTSSSRRRPRPGNAPEIPAARRLGGRQGAVCFNLYFLVPTGRGVEPHGPRSGEDRDPARELAAAESRHRGTMMVRAKCAPHFMRHVHQADPDSPVLSYRTRCPCGIDYCRITPDGKLTPCPYMPTVAGDLRAPVVRRDLVGLAACSPSSAQRELGGRCGRCEYRMVCGGCRARALATSGDYLAEDPGCVYEPPGDVPLVERQAVTYGSAPAPASSGRKTRARVWRRSPRSCAASSCSESRTSPARGASPP